MVERTLGVISTAVDHESLKRALRNRSPASFMSDTKWRKLFAAVADVPSIKHWVLKTIRYEEEEQVGYGRFDPWPSHAFIDTAIGPIYLSDIEWIEFPSIDPRRGGHEQDIQGLRRALDTIGKFPIEDTPRGLRIVGHVLSDRRDKV